jgi:hypothetical protein
LSWTPGKKKLFPTSVNRNEILEKSKKKEVIRVHILSSLGNNDAQASSE